MPASRTPSAPHPLLAPWVDREGSGAMKRLVDATGNTWASVGKVVWHGAMPSGETAIALAKATGHTTDEIIEGAVQARDARRARVSDCRTAARPITNEDDLADEAVS